MEITLDNLRSVFSSERTYSSIIRPCCGTSFDPLEEPGPYYWEPSAEVNNGYATLHKTFYFTLTDYARNSLSFWDGGTLRSTQLLKIPRIIPPSEVLRSSGFPQKGDRLAEDSHYYYTGNGTLEHISDDSRIWKYTAEYVSSGSELDDDGRDVDADTPPWKRKPTNVSVSFIEQQEPFQVAYNDSNLRFWPITDDDVSQGVIIRKPYNMIKNTAGDPINAQTVHRYTQISFTYNVRPEDFDIDALVRRQGTLNDRKVKVIGLTFPKGSAKIISATPKYIDEWDSSSFRRRRPYWQIDAIIQVNVFYETFNQRLLNVGSRAIFHEDGAIISGDGSYLDGTGSAFKDDIVSWNTWTYTLDNKYVIGKKTYGPRQAALVAKRIYDKQRQSLNGGDWPEFSYEQETQIPLKANGEVFAAAMDCNSSSFGEYLFLEYPEHAYANWACMNMPQKGVDW